MTNRTAYYAWWTVILYDHEQAVGSYTYPVGKDGLPMDGCADERDALDNAVGTWVDHGRITDPFTAHQEAES